MNNKKKLFREEVIHHKKIPLYGKVFINTPMPYFIVSVGAILIVILIILFLLFAEISETFVVRDYLNSTKGIIRIYPKVNGVIVESMVTQGKKVKKGEPLFLTPIPRIQPTSTADNFLSAFPS